MPKFFAKSSSKYASTMLILELVYANLNAFVDDLKNPTKLLSSFSSEI